MADVLFVRNRRNEEDSNDPWDDTALIQAYEEAFKCAKKELESKSSQSQKDEAQCSQAVKSSKKLWHKGDYCRCSYSEDGIIYEGQIVKILDPQNCIVKYIGYDNEEVVKIDILKRSKGSGARRKQKMTAKDVGGMDWDTTSGGISTEDDSVASEQRCIYVGSENQSKQFEIPAPPPPPPPLFNQGGNPPTDSNEALNAMLLSWYMSGYHTGYYEGLKRAKEHK